MLLLLHPSSIRIAFKGRLSHSFSEATLQALLNYYLLTFYISDMCTAIPDIYILHFQCVRLSSSQKHSHKHYQAALQAYLNLVCVQFTKDKTGKTRKCKSTGMCFHIDLTAHTFYLVNLWKFLIACLYVMTMLHCLFFLIYLAAMCCFI